MKDPLFRILLFCLTNAILHFITGLIYSQEYNPEKLMDSNGYLQRVAVFYLVPAAVFTRFLWTAYDIEATLVPLSKYFEHDAERARQDLSLMPFLTEGKASMIVNTGLSFTGTAGKPCEAKDVYREMIDLACVGSPKMDLHISQWCLVRKLWSAQLLLDTRLTDEGSRKFRIVWYVFSTVTVCLTICLFGFFAYQGIKDIGDICEGQYDDTASLLVEAAFIVLTGWLTWGFMHNVMVPFRTPPAA